jgi:ArsR family transcriptional regulator
MLDIGTGTGRMLELFAPVSRHAIGLDANRDMLNVARANLDAAGIDHAEVRFGDIFNLPFGRDQFELIIIHQVLHYLDDPAGAIAEAVRALAPSGLLVVVDFATHDQEFLREQHAHVRLGFDNETVSGWFAHADVQQQPPIAVRGEDIDEQDAPLTVMLWPVRDTRILIADEDISTQQEELA